MTLHETTHGSTLPRSAPPRSATPRSATLRSTILRKGVEATAIVLALGALLASGLLPSAAFAGDEDGQRHKVIIARNGMLPCDALGDHEGFRKTRRAFLGIEATSLTPELRRHFGVPDDAGVMVGQVVEGSAAEQAGLRVGDILTRVDGRDIHGGWDVSNALANVDGGSVVDVEYWRDGTRTALAVTLGEKETCQLDLSMHLDGLSNLEHLDLGNLPGLELSAEALETALEAIQDIDWEDSLRGLEDLRLEGLEGLDEQMEDLRHRMEELHERMAIENEHLGRDMESTLRERMRAIEERERVRIETREELRRAQEVQREAARERSMAVREQARAAEEAARRELEEELARARAQAAEGGGPVYL